MICVTSEELEKLIQVVLEAMRISKNDRSNCIQEVLLLFVLRFADQAKQLLAEELWISNDHTSKHERRCHSYVV